MSIPSFAIWANKNSGEEFTLWISHSPNYPLFKSFQLNAQNILDFKKQVGRNLNPGEGTYLCYFDNNNADNVYTVVGHMTDVGEITWRNNVESRIIDPATVS